MALGTALAIGLGTAVLGAGGAVLSSSAQKKAANRATDAATQTADKNNALSREIYGQNKEALSPFMERGNKAGDAINALLGLGGPEPSPQMPQNQFAPGQGSQSPTNPMMGGFNQNGQGGFDWREPRSDNGGFSGLPGVIGGFGGGTFNMDGSQATPMFAQNQPQAAQPAQGPGSAQQQQENAFGVFRNSTGYQFRLGEGQNALNAASGGRGVSRSGAAVKSLANYNQNMASNEFGNYMGYLGNQQGIGLQGASALAGVGNNFVSQQSANNDSAGTAAANAALLRGQANADMFGQIGSSFGKLGGTIFGGSGNVVKQSNGLPGIY